jgi:peptidoglycan/xylan/chitin deacetylase (PgdA/CDA1 family)
MSLQRRFHHLLINPIVIIAPIVVGLLFAWNHYLFVTQHFNLPTNNLMSYTQFKTVDAQGTPRGWQIEKQGALEYQLREERGHAGGNTLEIKLSHYIDGALAVRSPVVNVSGGQRYFFKGYYAASASFDLLVRTYYSDGTSSMKLIDTFPATDKNTWSTVSSLIDAPTTARATQIIYRLHNNGFVRLNSDYLEQRNSGLASLAMPKPTNENIIPNSDLRDTSHNYNLDKEVPTSWSEFQSGKNSANFVYNTDSIPYVGVHVSGYKNGEIKWQYEPQTVTPGTRYTYSADYQSNVGSALTAEYTMQDGSYRFDTISNLPPSPEWSRVEQQVEVPKGAATLVITNALHQNGWLNTRQQLLANSSVTGRPFFDHPLVSLTFDDGWQSTYDNAIPILNHYGYKGTFYVNPLSLDTKSFMSTAEMHRLISSKHEVASHGLKHINFTTVNAKELDTQLGASKTFVSQQTGMSTIDFATPYGETDAEVNAVAKHYYQSSRGTESGINTRQNFDPYNLRVLFMGPDMKTAQITQAIDEARAHNGWLILVYHQIQNKKSSENITPDTFRKQLQLIQHSNLPVPTIESALQEIYPQL